MAKIYHAHLYGLREDKYQILKKIRLTLLIFMRLTLNLLFIC